MGSDKSLRIIVKSRRDKLFLEICWLQFPNKKNLKVENICENKTEFYWKISFAIFIFNSNENKQHYNKLAVTPPTLWQFFYLRADSYSRGEILSHKHYGLFHGFVRLSAPNPIIAKITTLWNSGHTAMALYYLENNSYYGLKILQR